MLSAFSRFGGLAFARVLRRSDDAARSVGLGIGFGVLAFLLFSSMDMMVKLLSAGYPIHQMLFFNALFSLLPITFAIWRSGGFHGLRTDRPLAHLTRGLFGMTASFAAMTAFSLMPMARCLRHFVRNTASGDGLVDTAARRDRRMAALVGDHRRLCRCYHHAAAR